MEAKKESLPGLIGRASFLFHTILFWCVSRKGQCVLNAVENDNASCEKRVSRRFSFSVLAGLAFPDILTLSSISFCINMSVFTKGIRFLLGPSMSNDPLSHLSKYRDLFLRQSGNHGYEPEAERIAFALQIIFRQVHDLF